MQPDSKTYDFTSICSPDPVVENLTEKCLRYHNDFLKEEKVQKQKQDIVYAKELIENKRKTEQKILKQSLNQISYFNIPTLRTIKTILLFQSVGMLK